MSDVNTGDVLRLGCGFLYDESDDVVNVWHVEVVTASGLDWATVSPYIQAWCDALYTDLKSTLSNDLDTDLISVSNVTQGTTLGAIGWSPAWLGSSGIAATASGVSLFTWARTYKPRVQIRKYFGVFTETDMEDGSWSVAARADAEAAMTYAIAAQTMATPATARGET